MTKYIEVKLNLKKIIPVEDDNLDSAFEKAEKIFYDNELTEEYLNARNIEFSECIQIMSNAKAMAEILIDRYGVNITKEEVETHFYEEWNKSEKSSFIFDELIKILESDYNFSFEKVKI